MEHLDVIHEGIKYNIKNRRSGSCMILNKSDLFVKGGNIGHSERIIVFVHQLQSSISKKL